MEMSIIPIDSPYVLLMSKSVMLYEMFNTLENKVEVHVEKPWKGWVCRSCHHSPLNKLRLVIWNLKKHWANSSETFFCNLHLCFEGVLTANGRDALTQKDTVWLQISVDYGLRMKIAAHVKKKNKNQFDKTYMYIATFRGEFSSPMNSVVLGKTRVQENCQWRQTQEKIME